MENFRTTGNQTHEGVYKNLEFNSLDPMANGCRHQRFRTLKSLSLHWQAAAVGSLHFAVLGKMGSSIEFIHAVEAFIDE